MSKKLIKTEIAADFLESRLDNLPGVGEKRSRLLAKLGLVTVNDAINFFPRKYEDHRCSCKISELADGQKALVYAFVDSVDEYGAYGGKAGRTTAKLVDASGRITAFWFNRRNLNYLLPKGSTALFYGDVTSYGGKLQLSNPEFEVTKRPAESRLSGIVPVYSSTEGLKPFWFKKFLSALLEKIVPEITETLPQQLLEKRQLMAKSEAIAQIHNPKDENCWQQARRRLAYEELLTVQSGLAMRRHVLKSCTAATKIIPGAIYKTFKDNLPFTATNSQLQALSEIFKDTASAVPMSRLLQGDVGSGKTLVAVGLAAACHDSRVQCAVMAPTEVLATQLYSEMQRYLAPLGVNVVLIKGGQRLSERNRILAMAENGEAQVVVGTQALLFDRVKFKSLAAVIIDEQHRFGVEQRRALVRHGLAPHLLMMSATPIPRSLAMTLFADLDISALTEKPAGRRKIETRLTDMKKMRVLLKFIAEEAINGGRVYWVCPRVEENNYQLPITDDEWEKTGAQGLRDSGKTLHVTNDELQMTNNQQLSAILSRKTPLRRISYQLSAKSVKDRYEFLEKYLGKLGVGLVYGGMESEEKEKTLSKFRSGEIKILTGTTVIEVGIDVPEASVMVIEAPECFGLSQLHQLRGRVGRGERRGVCILLTQTLDAEIAERLKIMLETDDGFEIAEADLELRGSGKISGSEQHGITEFRLANLKKDIKLIQQAREDAAELVESGIEKCPQLLLETEKRWNMLQGSKQVN